MAGARPGGVALSPEGRLAQQAKAQLVPLRFFAGLSAPEAAAALGVSVATAERWWAYARTWLFSELSGGEENSSAP